jgi:hypothetical protein
MEKKRMAGKGRIVGVVKMRINSIIDAFGIDSEETW